MMGQTKSKTLNEIEQALKNLFNAICSYIGDLTAEENYLQSKSYFETMLRVAIEDIGDYIAENGNSRHLDFLIEVQHTLSTDISTLLNSKELNVNDLQEKSRIVRDLIHRFHYISQDISLWNKAKHIFNGFATEMYSIGSSLIRPAIEY